MKVEVKKLIVVILVVVAMAAYFLRLQGIADIPGLTSGALAVGLGLLTGDMLSHRENKKNKLIGVLMAAMSILMVLTCALELLNYFGK